MTYYISGGKRYGVPDDKTDDFLKKMPDAERIYLTPDQMDYIEKRRSGTAAGTQDAQRAQKGTDEGSLGTDGTLGALGANGFRMPAFDVKKNVGKAVSGRFKEVEDDFAKLRAGAQRKEQPLTRLDDALVQGSKRVAGELAYLAGETSGEALESVTGGLLVPYFSN